VVTSCSDEMVAPPPPPGPVADFSWDGVTVMPAQITFQNLSANANEYVWNFGDFTSSNDTNPTHIFATAGLYDVTLTARASATGATNAKTIQLPIDTGQVVANYILPASAVTYSAVTFENRSRNAGSYRWSFGDGRSSELTRPTTSYSTYRTYTTALIAFSRDGRRSDTLSQTLTVNPGKVYLDSVFVVQYPLTDAANHPWDQDAGPDMFWTLVKPSGQTIRSQTLADVLPDSLPVGWRTPIAALLLDDPQFSYIINFFDSDPSDSALMGTIGFLTNQLPTGGQYLPNRVFLNDGLQVRLALRWL